MLAPSDSQYPGHHMTWERVAPPRPAQNFTLRMAPDPRSDLERIAERLDRDLSYVIRKAIDEYIERYADAPDGD